MEVSDYSDNPNASILWAGWASRAVVAEKPKVRREVCSSLSAIELAFEYFSGQGGDPAARHLCAVVPSKNKMCELEDSF